MQVLRAPSPTYTPGHKASISSDLVTSWPGREARCSSTANAFGVRGRGPPAARSRPLTVSRQKGPNAKVRREDTGGGEKAKAVVMLETSLGTDCRPR